MQAEEVAKALVAGLAAYGVQATYEVEARPEGRWGLSVNFEPDGVMCEGVDFSQTFRVMWSGGTVDNASLGKALDCCVIDAGQPLQDERPKWFRR